MAYLMKYKGIYRILPELDLETNDIPRDNETGEIMDGYDDIYIACKNGAKISTYGHINNTKPVWLLAYVPSLIRGRKIVRELEEKGVEIVDYMDTDEEVEFKFKAADIEVVAELMKAKTSGASISPYSSRNLPKAKVTIPSEELAKYKEITSVVPREDMLFIHRTTVAFLTNVLEKRCKKSNKKFSYKMDMKKLKLSRQTKEYIHVKGYWEEYLKYLEKEITKIYK